MNGLHLFLPCGGGVEAMLLDEVMAIISADALRSGTAMPPTSRAEAVRGGVVLYQGSWREALLLNLHSRLAMRVLIQLSRTPYRSEADVYEAASQVAWEVWFTTKNTFKVDITAHQCPLQSLNFAALKVKDALVDRFRNKTGVRPDVDTHWPHVRVHAHLSQDTLSLYVDTSGEPLFKRGWRMEKGDAPLKETLAAAMIAASGWLPFAADGTPNALYDPCCGSGTIAIEAAQIALKIPAGSQRRFGFEHLVPFQAHVWDAIKDEAYNAHESWTNGLKGREISIFGSDVAFRMVDFAQHNAERAGVAEYIEFRGGDALQRMPPIDGAGRGGVMLINPPYGERIETAGVAGEGARESRAAQVQRFGQGSPSDRFEPPSRNERPQRPQRPQQSEFASAGGQTTEESDFFSQLATHWKRNFAGWTAWVLTPNLKLPSAMRLKESRRVPMWNGPIECRMFRFDMVTGSAQTRPKPEPSQPLSGL